MRPVILVCTPDAGFYLLISYILKAEGFDCIPASDAAKTAEILADQPIAATLLDCTDDILESPQSLDRIKQTSRAHSALMIALIRAGNEPLYLELLKAGFDEIFISPYPPEHLLQVLKSRVENALSYPVGANLADTVLSMGKLNLFPQRHRVQYDDREVVLKPIQFKVLAVMIAEPGRIFSREELIEAVWPNNIHVEPRTVDVHIGRLRGAMRRAAGRDLIRTVRAVGYGLDLPNDSSNPEQRSD